MRNFTVLRPLIALMLCLLLPLQAGATLARATAMALHGGAASRAAATTAAEAPALPLLAHGDHAADSGADPHALHHAGHHDGASPAHATHGGHEGHDGHSHTAAPVHHPPKAAPAQTKPASHQSVHAKAGCSDCAKCCLLAASAPPPVLPSSFPPAVARAAFAAHHAPAPAFVTDGPDRPPRHFAA